ncbi:F1F0 ATP synthase subunit gamma [Maudiozyma humilis]|uniref:ATP synthase subunit gamma n=1 Tax=Maudiozyma humilis TaxID=51915 RepID=A0AAV5S4R7_MAUHU|nr:F1F0 ATP synthase subunit gamma [Kazachstania humilis]
MLSRNLLSTASRAAVRSPAAAARGYATLKEVELRLKSIKNIEKITKTMKIVASTRLSKAQKAKAAAKMIDAADSQFYDVAKTSEVAAGAEKPQELAIAITSDKGLCGSIHSQLAKAVRRKMAEHPNTDIIAIGDKIKMQLLRTNPDSVKLAFNGIGKDAPTFYESSLIAAKILQEVDAQSYAKISIFFNDPVSSLSFEPAVKPIYSAETIQSSPGYNVFEIDPEGKLPADLFEYSLTSQILSAMAQGYAAEISARRNAMDNASKNAGDMINRYSILYNRTRQAVITNELVDIITGASSLD